MSVKVPPRSIQNCQVMRPTLQGCPSCNHKAMLGILTLDTAFPRIRGDVGCPETFDFPVKYVTVAGADPTEVVDRASDAALPQFVEAAQRLVDEGCVGVATTCGFLVRWQRPLADQLRVPVLTSSTRRCAASTNWG